MTPITNVSGIGPSLGATLAKKGINTAEQLAAVSVAELTTIPGIGAFKAKSFLAAASQLDRSSPTVDKARAPIVSKTADDMADKKAAEKKAKAKKKAAKKAAKKKGAKVKAATKKKAKEKKAIKKRIKKAIKKKKAKKAARKALKADKKAIRA